MTVFFFFCPYIPGGPGGGGGLQLEILYKLLFVAVCKRNFKPYLYVFSFSRSHIRMCVVTEGL